MLRYIEIRQKILNDFAHHEANFRLPARSKLCEMYLVSRTTVDRAVASLIRDGYLYTVPSGGTFLSGTISDNPTIHFNEVNIGVLVPNINHDTYPGIIRGIEDYMHPYQINVVICSTDNDCNRQHFIIKRLLNSKINGLILVPAILNGESLPNDYLQALKNIKIPLILCNRNIEGLNAPVICSNNYYGGYLATSHLIKVGYKNIGHISALHYQTSTARFQGYLAALWENDLQFNKRFFRRALENINVETGYQITLALLKEEKTIDALFCFNDQLACGAINAIHDVGLTVSKDIGVIGYDNSKLCSVPSVKLTSVSFKNYEIGLNAAQLLLSMIKNPLLSIEKEQIFCPEIYIRESCLGPKSS